MKDWIGGAVPADAWAWDNYLLLPAQRRLLRDGEPVEVEDRVLDLLVLLLQHRGRALDRQEIITAIWGKRPVGDATLRQLVYKARRAIGDDGDHQMAISTLYGRSLQWIMPVEAVLGIGEAHDDQHLLPPAGDSTSDTSAPTRWMPAAHAAWLVAVLVLLALGGGVVFWMFRRPLHRGTGAAGSIRTGDVTVAVLPFLDLDTQKDQGYVSDGLTAELISRLARMPHLRVTARTSSFAFRDKPEDVREVARQLGVRHVVEGSVQRSGHIWRTRVALVDVGNGYEVWAGEYNVDAGDLLQMEDKIARSVVVALYPKLDPAALTAPPDRPRVSAVAHDDYLVGLQYLDRRDTADIEKAIGYFESAAKIDPGYADAWSGMAVGYAVLRDYDSDVPPDTHYGDALAAARTAVALDPQSARGHMVLGLLYEEHWQWATAKRELGRALELDPSDATAHQWYAIYFWFTGDMRAALGQMRMAYALDPLSPIINADLSRALLYTGDVDGAIRQAQAAVALAPRFELPHLFLASALVDKGLYPDSIREIRVGISLTPSPPTSDELAFLGLIQATAGDRDAARKLLDAVETRARQHYVSGVSLASIEWSLGEKSQAFANLDRAVVDHDHLLMRVSGKRDDDWCADPRFSKMLAGMNLPMR